MSLINKLGSVAIVAGSLANGVVAQDESQDSDSATNVNVREQPIVHAEDTMAPVDGAYDNGEIQQEPSDFLRFEEADSESALPFSVFMNTGIHSKYRVDGGFILTDGPVNQSLFDIGFSNVLSDGDAFDVYVWSNTDLERGSLSEFDVGAVYSRPLLDDFLGGKLGADLELALFDYPDEAIAPNHDTSLMGRLNYTEGPLVDLTFEATQFLTSGSGREYDLIASKTFDIGKIGDFDLSFTPEVSAAYLERFFGHTGVSNFQYGASLSATDGSFSVEGYLEQQEALLDGFESGLVGGIRLSLGF